MVGCNSATSSGLPAREHRRIVRILPLDAGTCCGNVLPVDPGATRGPPLHTRPGPTPPTAQRRTRSTARADPSNARGIADRHPPRLHRPGTPASAQDSVPPKSALVGAIWELKYDGYRARPGHRPGRRAVVPERIQSQQPLPRPRCRRGGAARGRGRPRRRGCGVAATAGSTSTSYNAGWCPAQR